jgi:hypothetical protein
VRIGWVLALTATVTSAILFVACSAPDTALLIRVSRDATTPSTIPELRVYAGVATSETYVTGAQVYIDGNDPDATVDMSTRDLVQSPYRLVLRPGAALPLDAELEVVAAGFQSSSGQLQLLGFGALTHPVHFVEHETLTWDLVLSAPTAEETVSPLGCVDAQVASSAIHIGASGDWDCDADPHDTDCNDVDPAINHAAPEICDGIDNNCDGKCDDDVDGDGYSTCGTVSGSVCTVVTPPGGPCMPGQQCDCAPTFAGAHPVPPGAQAVPERCDGYDENCDGVLYPQHSMCFATDPTSQCLVGTRACNDALPSMPWGPCTTEASQTVDPILCTAYQSCFGDPTVVDPAACALRQSSLGVIACTDTISTGSTACTPATYSLPALIKSVACTTATWSIAGGAVHGPWTVGFVGTAGTSTAATGCAAIFVVESFDDSKATGTAATRILVTERLGTSVASVFIDLSAASAPTCSAIDNLTCTGP